MGDVPLQTALEIIKNDRRKVNDVEQKDFPWDQFIKYVSSAILALTLVNITLEFLTGDGISCFHPFDVAGKALTLTHARFINGYCSDSLPRTTYLPTYIFAHGLLFVIPHYVWSAFFKKDFDSFFLVATKINLLRDSSIGEYSEENFSRVRKLEKEYGGGRSIFFCFVLKLALQLLLSIFVLGISGGVFHGRFSSSFNCSLPLTEAGVVLEEFPENVTVLCVHSNLRTLYVVWITDFILTALVGVLATWGLLWCVLMWCGLNNGRQLGHDLVTDFAVESLLEPNAYVSPGRKQDFEKAIKSDLDFLLLTLYRSDTIYGEAFREIMVG